MGLIHRIGGHERAAAEMTFEEYQRQVSEVDAAIPEWRTGQTAFNVLYDIRPELADAVRATELDPFYQDELLPAFYARIEEDWS